MLGWPGAWRGVRGNGNTYDLDSNLFVKIVAMLKRRSRKKTCIPCDGEKERPGLYAGCVYVWILYIGYFMAWQHEGHRSVALCFMLIKKQWFPCDEKRTKDLTSLRAVRWMDIGIWIPHIEHLTRTRVPDLTSLFLKQPFESHDPSTRTNDFFTFSAL